VRANIRELDTKSEDFRIKYKNGTEIQKLVTDLNGIQSDNLALQQQMAQLGL